MLCRVPRITRGCTEKIQDYTPVQGVLFRVGLLVRTVGFDPIELGSIPRPGAGEGYAICTVVM